MNRISLAMVLLTIGLIGCGSEKGVTRNQRGPITLSEIEEAGLVFNDALDVVRHFRPGWLIRRGVARIPSRPTTEMYDYVAVYEDRTFLGDIEELRQIGVQQIGSIERLGPTETQFLSPFFHAHGAIIVHSRIR